MHEVSICQSIINSLEAELKEEKLEQIREVHLKVGILSTIEPSLLKHVFTFMIVDTPLRHAVLQIDMVDVLVGCEHCNKKFKVEKYKFICPHCDKPSSNIIEGNELQIDKIILEELAYEKVNQ